MHRQIKASESGQVLVILVFGIVVLLGFAALAIDGGMYYSDRRFDQNAADASALAGAGGAANALDTAGVSINGFNCADTDVVAAITAAETAAIQRAAANGFVIDNDISDDHGVQVTCEDAGGESGSYLYISVAITTTTQTSFAHLIFAGDLENTVEAVTRVEPGDLGPFADGYALLALRHECKGGDGGLEFDGDSGTRVVTGGAFSNACIVKDGTADVQVDAGAWYFTEYANNGTSGSILPDPDEAEERIAMQVDEPACDSLPWQGEVKKGASIQPGRYSKISITNKDTLTMAPGLYCLAGTFKATGGVIEVSGSDDEGVTIFLSGGDFDIAGGAQVNLRAPMEGFENPPAIPGMLIYMAESNTGVIKINGNADSTYRGTVYAPSGSIEVGGTASALGTLSSQFVADKVKVHGNPGLRIEFEDGEIYQSTEPSFLDFYQ
jgi:hypothetical protein